LRIKSRTLKGDIQTDEATEASLRRSLELAIVQGANVLELMSAYGAVKASTMTGATS
jgi:hypothetical protein